MFERRLKILLIAPAICAIIILGRLFQLQVVQGRTYVRKVDAALTGPMRTLPPLRGRILDRLGRVLAADEPTHDVSVHFGVLSKDKAFREKMAARLRDQEPDLARALPGESSADVEQRLLAEVERRIEAMWFKLERASGTPLHELHERRDVLCANVARLQEYIHRVRKSKGLDQEKETIRLREHDKYHVMLRDVSADVRTRIEVDLADDPFVRIEPSVRRMWREDAQPFCHLIGSMGQVSPEMMSTDPMADDPLGAYRAGDLAGVSGIEGLAENRLRGKRGQEERSLDGEVLMHVDPVDGTDVRLTLDLDLQNAVAGILMRKQPEHPTSTGAACVVLDIQRREVLAMVSVPSYTRDYFREHFDKLRDDVLGQPLLFKPIQCEYPPGSTIKPVTLLAGLASGHITAETTAFCDGSLVPGSKYWHCWTFAKRQSGHGTVSAETALQHSCNIYFYQLGGKLGANVLTDFFRDFCRGPERNYSTQRGTGLSNEHFGIIPTKEYLKRRFKRDYAPSDARNYSIGQGELQLTPLQVANMFATLGAGVYRDPAVIMDSAESRPVQRFKTLKPQDWDVARRGLYRCVNEQGGTAYSYVQMPDLEVCGKTGSSQCVPRVTKRRFVFETAEKGQLTIDAPTVEQAREILGLPQTAKYVSRAIVETWPPKDVDTKDYPTHAWFAGFAPYDHPRIAIAVLIEHGGAGGKSAGPTAKEVLEAVAASPRGYFTIRPRDIAAAGSAP